MVNIVVYTLPKFLPVRLAPLAKLNKLVIPPLVYKAQP